MFALEGGRETDTQSSLASLMSDPHQPVAHTDNQSNLGSLMSDPAQTSVGSFKSDDNMGEPARRSTPLQTPDRKVGSVIIKNSEPAKTVKISQFAVSKVVAEEVAVVESAVDHLRHCSSGPVPLAEEVAEELARSAMMCLWAEEVVAVSNHLLAVALSES